MFEHVDEEKMKYVCNKILENRAIQISNSQIWTAFLDEQLREFVVQYNFNFFEVANRFHDFIAFPYKYDFSEDEIRRHWSFLHACRYLGIEIDDDYYDKLKARAKEEEKENKMKAEDELDLEKEKRNMDKYKAERFNLIDMGDNPKKVNDLAIDDLDYDNPIEQNLKNDEHFEKCIENIDLRKNENMEALNINNNKENISNKNEKEMEVDTTFNKNNEIKTEKSNNKSNNSKNETNQVETTESLVMKSINAVNENIKKEDNNKVEKLSGFDDDDVINALFNVTQKISTEEELPKALTIDGKDYKLPETKEIKEEDLFPINTKFLPEVNLTEEERENYRQKMLIEFNKEGMDKAIDKTKNFDDLIKEDENLKTQYDNLNTYFKFAVRSLNYFVPKMNKNLKENVDGNNPENQTNDDKGKYNYFNNFR